MTVHQYTSPYEFSFHSRHTIPNIRPIDSYAIHILMASLLLLLFRVAELGHYYRWCVAEVWLLLLVVRLPRHLREMFSEPKYHVCVCVFFFFKMYVDVMRGGEEKRRRNKLQYKQDFCTKLIISVVLVCLEA